MFDNKLGVAPSDARALCGTLQQILADLSVAAANAATCHWNLAEAEAGPMHLLLRALHQDHRDAQDDVAERIRALGGRPEGRPAALAEAARLDASDGGRSDAERARAVLADQTRLAEMCRELAAASARVDDAATGDLAEERADRHHKFALRLRAQLKG